MHAPQTPEGFLRLRAWEADIEEAGVEPERSEMAWGRLCIPSTQWHQDRVSEGWGAVRPK